MIVNVSNDEMYFKLSYYRIYYIEQINIYFNLYISNVEVGDEGDEGYKVDEEYKLDDVTFTLLSL